VIKIVSSLPRTGSARGQTDTIVNGIRMAFDEAGWKAGDFAIEYEDLDDATAADGKWNPERETANATKAVQDPNVMVYIGPYNSGAATNSMPVLNKASLLMISPACTAIGLTKKGGEPGEPEIYRPTGKVNFTRVVPADDIQGAVGAEFAAKDLKVKTVYVLDDNEVYGRGVATVFRETCGDLGVKVLGRQESIDYRQSDFRTLMQRIKNDHNPELIYFGGTSQTGAGQIAKDMVAVGLKAKLMVPDGCYENAFIQAAGADTFKTLQAYVTFGGVPPDKLEGKGGEFVKKYQAKYNVMPEGYAIYGYESALVALEAIKKAGKKDRKAILDAALGIKEFDGALGKWGFDANGDTTSKMLSVSTVEGKDFKFVKQFGK
jgi:branched-chain amino acid transport system substrate-binding protein